MLKQLLLFIIDMKPLIKLNLSLVIALAIYTIFYSANHAIISEIVYNFD